MDAPSGGNPPRLSGSSPFSSPVHVANIKAIPAAAAQFRGSSRYLWHRFAYLDAEFVELDESYIQGEEFITSLETRLDEMRDHPEVVSAECDHLRVINVTLVGKCKAAHREVLGPQARVTKLGSKAQPRHVSAAELADALPERDRYEVL